MVFPAFVEICILFNGHDPLDACLNNRASAVHARRVGDEDRAADRAEACPRCAVNCVPLCVFRPHVLLWALSKAFVFVGGATSRSAVVSPRPAFAFGPDEQCAYSGRIVLTELRDGSSDRHEFYCFCLRVVLHLWPTYS